MREVPDDEHNREIVGNLDLAGLTGTAYDPERYYAVAQFAVALDVNEKIRQCLVELLEVLARSSPTPPRWPPSTPRKRGDCASGSSSRSTASLSRAL